MGTSWDTPPEFWATQERQCASCQLRFEITAEEQRFWYEVLQIPMVVGIVHCQGCRQKRRTLRRIMGRLNELVPRIDADEASDSELREAVLVVAEGMVRRLPTAHTLSIPIIQGPTLLQQVSRWITRLRKGSSRHADLLPVAILAQRRLGNERRADQLEQQAQTIRATAGRVGRSLRMIETWLHDPTASRRKRVFEFKTK